MGFSRGRLPLVAGILAIAPASLPAGRSPQVHAAPAAHVARHAETSAIAIAGRKLKECALHTIDSFGGGVSLMHILRNSQLTSRRIEAGTSVSFPNQKFYTDVLQAHAMSAAEPQAFGRSFVIPQNWSKADSLGFWYYGHNTGKAITVKIRANSAPDPGPSGWTLHWSDEFNGPAGSLPNPAVWGYDLGDGNGGWGNHELEYYTNKPENVSLDGNGNLAITARAEPPGTNLTCYYGSCQYTSARILTQHKLVFGYGRIEARMKIPAGTGLWPAFWALGSNIGTVGWPTSGEIDIMENVGREPDTIHGTIHGPGYSGANGITAPYNAPSPLSDAFHTYAVDWTPNRITWYIDGIQYHTVTPQDVEPNKWVYNQPFFLILNLAVGGDFGGPVDPSLTFPRSLLVDYVRVYTAPDTAERFYSKFDDTFTGWKHITLPFSSFRHGGVQPSGAPVTPLSLHSISGYTFTVPAGYPDPVMLSNVQTEHGVSSGTCIAE